MRRPESKLDVLEIIGPYLDRSLAEPVPQQVVAAIKKDSIDQKVSIPAIIAWRVYQEGLGLSKHFERTFHLPRGFLEGEETLTCFSMLYSVASGHIRDVESYIRGEEVTEQATQEAVKQRFLANPQETDTLTYAANLHVILTSLVQLMKDDSTGFAVVDRIAYGPPIPNSPFTILHQYPPMVKIIQIGAERYKSLYRAISQLPTP